MAVNMIRDFEEATKFVTSIDPSITPHFLASYPKAAKIAVQAARGKLSAEDQAIYDEWRQAGGKISYNSFKDVTDRAKEFADLVGETNPSEWYNLPAHVKTKALKAIKGVLHGLDKISEPFEDTTRLAIFMGARKVKDPKGAIDPATGKVKNKYSVEQAARFAQEGTVNFYRKGKWTPYINGLYIFFNAAMQGIFTEAKLLKNSGRARALYASLLPIGFMILLHNLSMSDDDEMQPGRKNYMNIPEWERANGIIWKTGKGPKDYIRIPMPKLMMIPLILAEKLGTAAMHQDKLSNAVGQAGVNIVDALNPLGGSSFLSAISPTLIDPFVDIAANRSFSGAPIHPQPEKWNAGIPKAQQAFTTTSPTASHFAQWMQSHTGIDMYPGDLEYAIKTMVGGLGKTSGNVVGWLDNLRTGKETKISDVPLVRAFVSSNWDESQRYYQLHNNLDERINQLRAAGKKTSDDPKVAAVSETVRTIDSALKVQRELLIKNRDNKDLTPKEKQAKDDAIRERIKSLMVTGGKQLSKIQ